MRLWPLAALVILSGCQCGLVPVDECTGPRCFKDGGADAGLDAGPGPDGGPGACAVWDGGGVGKCAAITGFVFSNDTCSGQCVLKPIVTAGIYETLPECLTDCEARCNTSKLMTVPNQVFAPPAYCDTVEVRTSLGWMLAEAFPTLDAGCVHDAISGQDQCQLWKGYLGDAGYSRACQATLLPGVVEVRCLVFVK